VRQLQHALQAQNANPRADPFASLTKKCRDELGFGDVTVKPSGSVLRTSMTQPVLQPVATKSKLSGRVVLGVHMHSDYAELVLHVMGAKAPTLPSVAASVTGLPTDTVGAVASAGTNSATTDFDDPANAGLKRDLGANLESLGLNLNVDDLIGSLGPSLEVAIGNVPRDGEEPQIAVRTRPGNRSSLDRTIAALNKGFESNGSSTRLVARDLGGDVMVTNSSPYADKVASGGGLGRAKRFKKAVGPLDGTVCALGYVDLRRILDAQSDHGGAAHALVAAGFAVTNSDGIYTLRVRVVAD
jgi:hypothetical protein